MYQFVDGFIGYCKWNLPLLFSGTDSQELYEANLKSGKILDYYKNNPITYNHNDWGHRCKNVNEIDLDNYILFTGCSNTEGIGSYIEDTYPYILSQKLNCDYYNLGLGGSGTDIMFHNLSTWIMKIRKPPKLLVYQWQTMPRFSVVVEGDYIQTLGPWGSEKKYNDALIVQDELRIFETRNIWVKKFLSELSKQWNILEIHMTMEKSISEFNVLFPLVDKGRDNLHPGPMSNNMLADILEKKYLTLFDK